MTSPEAGRSPAQVVSLVAAGVGVGVLVALALVAVAVNVPTRRR